MLFTVDKVKGEEIMQIIERRAFNLLQYILTNNYCAVDKAMMMLGCTERQLSYDISKINDLIGENISPIRISKGRIVVSNITKKEIKALDLTNQGYMVEGKNKIWLICIMIFSSATQLGLNDFITDFKSSRSTVINDLRKLSQIAKEYQVEVLYTRGRGYHFAGKAKNIRTLVLFAISSIKDNFLCKEMITISVRDKEYTTKYQTTKELTERFIKEYNLPVIKEYLVPSIYFISILSYHCKSLMYQPVYYHEQLWSHLPLYTAVMNLYQSLDDDIPIEEVEYLFILFISMTLGTDIYSNIYTKENLLLRSLSKELANRFEAITGARLKDRENVVNNMYMHLQPAFFRLKYGIPVVNPVIDQIKRDYSEIFSICRLVLEPFSDYVDCFIPDDEIGYITIHFLAMLDTTEPNKMRRRAVIVCQNGIASSALMKNQLTRMFPEVVFLDPCNLEDFKDIKEHQYDLIFSTTDQIEKPPGKHLFVIPSILTTDEKIAITETVYAEVFGLKTEHSITVNAILDIVSEYADIRDEVGLKNALGSYMKQKNKVPRKEVGPMISELIKEDTIQFVKEISDWEAALKLGAKPLLDNGTIEQIYIDAMIENVKEHGPYIVICPNVAIPHATNKVGVNKLGMSYLKLEKPVNILDNPEKAVKVLITLAASDDKTHLKALAQLSTLLSDVKLRDQLVACETFEAVSAMLEMVSK